MNYKKYKEILTLDRRNSNGAGHLKFYFTNVGYKLVVNYRRCQFLNDLSQKSSFCSIWKIIYSLQRLRYHKLCAKYGCDITSHTKIGKGFCIYHPYGLVVNPECVIGNFVELGAHVVLGRSKGLSPVIGDGVSIGANATVVGGVTIGKNAVIGAGAIVTSDVPENAVVICDKAHILKYR